MPAQSVATPVTPAAASTPRSTPGAAREADGGNERFGRQLDAARGQHGASNAPDGAGQNAASRSQGADASAAANGPVEANAASAAQASVTNSVLGTDHHGTPHAASDDDADGTDPGQLAVPMLLPLLGAALPGAMAHRGAFASTAGALLGGHGAAAVTAGIADAARLLQLAPADAQAAGQQAGTAATLPGGLQSILDAARGLSADDGRATNPATTPAALASTQLAPLPVAPAGTHMLALGAPVGSDAFHQELAGQVTWLTTQDVKQARIRVHPEDLGPIDLKVSINHDHVDVVFSAQQPGTVQALQQSLPQLGQMLAQHGLSLGQADVGQHGGNQPSTAHHDHAAGAIDEVGELHTSIVAGVTTAAPNLLDAFA